MVNYISSSGNGRPRQFDAGENHYNVQKFNLACISEIGILVSEVILPLHRSVKAICLPQHSEFSALDQLYFEYPRGHSQMLQRTLLAVGSPPQERL